MHQNADHEMRRDRQPMALAKHHALRLTRALAVIMLVASSALPSMAQTTSATLSGTITDAQGGVLPGATVILTSKTQGNTLTATTSDQGRFVFAIVRPDSYTLTASIQGFKTAERTNVVVAANDRASTGAIKLEVGGMTETVAVDSRVSELQIESGERSFVLGNEALSNIANNGRQLFNFANLVPGAVSNSAAGAEIGQVSGFTVNGQRPNSNNMTIDGVANIDTGDNGGNMATTNIDAVSEIKFLTNAYGAEYGRAVGGQLQVVTKSGTQQFHGSGYWYGRRSDWNANSWTNKRNAAAAPIGNGAVTIPPKSGRDDYGFTIGGPVFIPGKFNEDKKKLFFFFSKERQERTDPRATAAEGRVPTALERLGDFSQSVDGNGNRFPYIRDYLTGLPCSAADTRGCFADGGVLGKIPQSRLYTPGLNALKIFPQPNFTGSSGINYSSQDPNVSLRDEDMLRLDFQASDKWRVTGRYMRTMQDNLQAYGTTWAGNGSDRLPMPVTQLLPGRNYMLKAEGVLNPTTSLEVQVGRASNSLNYFLERDDLYRAPAGLSSMPLLFPSAVQADYIPDMRFGGGRSGNAGFYQTDRGPFTNENITHDVVANLTKIMGSHSTKFGVYFQKSYKPQSIFGSFNSQINFDDNANNPFDTGLSYANAATGVFNTYTQASKYALPEWVYKNIEAYGQDNWKVNSRLTVDYGVRFYHLTPQWDQTLQASNFDPSKFNASQAARLYYPVCIGAYPCSGANRRGMDPAIKTTQTPSMANTVVERFIGRLVPGSDRFNGAAQAGQGASDTLQDGNAFRISPRFGFTYDISGSQSTIVRGGFGIFYDRPQGNQVFDMIANAPGVLVSTLQWGQLQSLTAAGGDPNPTLSLNPSAVGFSPPKVTQWNVGMQHKLTGKMIFDLAYVGSTSSSLLRQEQINAVPRGAKFLAANQDPTRAPSTTPGATALPDDLLRPYQGYGNIRMWGYTGYGNYHSVQTGLSRRFDNGYMFSAFYVYGKALTSNNDDFAGGLPNATEEEVRRVDYSYANYDRPHNFVLNFIYETPDVASGFLGTLANKWQLSGVFRFTSGRPYAINYSIPGINQSNLVGNDGNPGARVVVTCDPGRGSSGDPYKQIDTSCFAPPKPGSDGAESARFFLWGPATNNLDLSLSKSVPLGGKRVRLEVRLDAFNALNHTQFTGVNATANFASLTDRTITNLPYDANGNLIRNNGFGSVNGVAAPRTLQLVTRLTF